MTPHPPSPDSEDHPELELLADLAEDLLPAEQAAELHAHLADCPECADTFVALAEVSALLGAIEPPPLPDAVADRIDAALAAESAARSAVTPAAPAARPAPGPSPAAPPARPTQPSGATGPGRQARPGRRRRGILLLAGAAALAGVLTLGGVLLQQRTGGDAATTAASDTRAQNPAAAAKASPSGGANHGNALQGLPEYRADNLPARVRELLGTGAASPALGAETSGSGAGTAGAPGCVVAAAGHPGESPLATASGRFGATPVTVLLYPSDGHAGQVDVYLVTPDCPGATVLLHDTVASR